VCGIDEYAGVLRRDDRFDDIGDIIYIGKGLDAEENIVEWLF
jgi:hypothetical protein